MGALAVLRLRKLPKPLHTGLVSSLSYGAQKVWAESPASKSYSSFSDFFVFSQSSPTGCSSWRPNQPPGGFNYPRSHRMQVVSPPLALPQKAVAHLPASEIYPSPRIFFCFSWRAAPRAVRFGGLPCHHEAPVFPEPPLASGLTTLRTAAKSRGPFARFRKFPTVFCFSSVR